MKQILSKKMVCTLLAILVIVLGVFGVQKYRGMQEEIQKSQEAVGQNNSKIVDIQNFPWDRNSENKSFIASFERNSVLEETIQAVSTSDWKIYKNQALNVEFFYANQFQIIEESSHDDGKLLGLYRLDVSGLEDGKIAEITIYSADSKAPVEQKIKSFLYGCSNILKIFTKKEYVLECTEEFEIPFFTIINPTSGDYVVINFNINYLDYLKSNPRLDAKNPVEYFGLVKTFRFIQ